MFRSYENRWRNAKKKSIFRYLIECKEGWKNILRLKLLLKAADWLQKALVFYLFKIYKIEALFKNWNNKRKDNIYRVGQKTGNRNQKMRWDVLCNLGFSFLQCLHVFNVLHTHFVILMIWIFNKPAFTTKRNRT